MNSLQNAFYRRKVIIAELKPFGFQRRGGEYALKRILPGSGFEATVTIADDGSVNITVVDPLFNEPYTMHLADRAAGSFVGGVRTEIERLPTDISEKCFESDVFKSREAKALIEYARMRYGSEPEFLWTRFPDNAVLRRSDSAKWYGVLLTVSKRKLGIDSDETVEIIDLRIAPEDMEALIDNQTYFHGWHMNKRTWYTVILDGSVSLAELRRRLDESYRLAIK